MFAELMTAETYTDIYRMMEHNPVNSEINFTEIRNSIKMIAKEELKHYEILHNYLMTVPNADAHYKKAMEHFQEKIIMKVKECVM
jgi:hypothetical protein